MFPRCLSRSCPQRQNFFELIRPHMADMAILSIHDTGVRHEKFFNDRHRAFVEFDRQGNRPVDRCGAVPARSDRTALC